MTLSVVTILTILAALAILFFGRRLFWLFVGIIGFITTFELAAEQLIVEPTWLVFLIALLVGGVGAILAIYLQYVVVGLAGFAAGLYLYLSLNSIIALDLGSLTWLPAVILGIIGAVVVVLFFDWALVILSASIGATMLAQTAAVDASIALLIFTIAFVIGVVVQGAMLIGRTDTARAGRQRRVIRE